MIPLQEITYHQDVFRHHLLVFLSKQDVGRMQSVSRGFLNSIDNETCWKILCRRDFEVDDETLHNEGSAKKAYEKWSIFSSKTCSSISSKDMIKAINLWMRCKNTLQKMKFNRILESLQPPPSQEFFKRAKKKLPSSLLAFYAIHAGQSTMSLRSGDDEFFAGLFGSYSCYDQFYSMRLLAFDEGRLLSIIDDSLVVTNLVIGINLGRPRTSLNLDFDSNPEGSVYMNNDLVCPDGILSYFQTYVERLENNIYQPCVINPEASLSRGICLFPETGDMTSVAITNGVEVRASARWFPGTGEGMNFGYSIRIRLVENEEGERLCQLVNRTWEFHHQDGTVLRVQGEGAVGKQPVLFRRPDGTTGFIDLGVAGNGGTYENTIFAYQSQSGFVPGTSSNDVTKTLKAHIRGSFGFCPGTIDSPTGPIFQVAVADFPLRVTLPFY